MVTELPLNEDIIHEIFDRCGLYSEDKREEIRQLHCFYEEKVEDCLVKSVRVPSLRLHLTQNSEDNLRKIQEYIECFTYNHTGTRFFSISHKDSLGQLMKLSRLIIDAFLPIKCIEAVLLAIYLTQELYDIKRFTISFTSRFEEQTFKHVVLGIYAGGKFGALGLSRRSDLMYKPLVYTSLSSLLNSFAAAYSKYRHQLLKVNLGFPVPHGFHLFERLSWKGLVMPRDILKKRGDMKRLTDKYTRALRGFRSTAESSGESLQLPEITKRYNANTVVETEEDCSSSRRDIGAIQRESRAHSVHEKSHRATRKNIKMDKYGNINTK